MSKTTISIRMDDRDHIKAEASQYGQDLVDFLPVMLHAWRETPEEKRWAAIKSANAREAEAAQRCQCNNAA